MDFQAQIAERVGQGILEVAEQQEKQLDATIAMLDNLDEDEFEALRQKRRQNLQRRLRQEQDWRQLGHGTYIEVTDTKEFFNAAKKSSRVVAHFYRGTTTRCLIVDSHLDILAKTHLETLFLKINVEKNPFLAEKLHIIVLPTIVLIRDGKTEHSIIGFDELGGGDDFATNDLAFVLSKHQVLDFDADRSDDINDKSSKAGVNRVQISNIRDGLTNTSGGDYSDEDF